MWMGLCRGSALWFVDGVEVPECTDLPPVGYHGCKCRVMCGDLHHDWLLFPTVFKEVSTIAGRNNCTQNMVMLEELQDNSDLLNPRDLVVSEARAPGHSCMSQFAIQQDKDHYWGRKGSAHLKQRKHCTE